jgi:hypothetical protein
LVDLLPQGYGRQELLKQLNRNESAEREADWDLLCAGAGNPIGNIRVKEAYDWITEKTGNVVKGFTLEEVAARAEDFNEYLAQHGLFLAGSSGVQGEWPKILLTRARDGLFYLDHNLPDEEAVEHFIVKFGRGPNPQLATILRLEEPYMRLAKLLGLNVRKAIQRKQDGSIGLTPLFDFAPMWLHPDGIARKMCWDADDQGSPIWSSVITQAAEAGNVERERLVDEVRSMATPLSELYRAAIDIGIEEKEYLLPIAKSLGRVRDQLENL